jgi:hypothetical protein
MTKKFSRYILDRFHPASTVRPFLIFFICGICVFSQSIAQVEDLTTRNDTTSSFFSRKTTLTYGIALHSALAIVLEYKWWWKNDYHPFEEEDEGFLNDYSLGVDKFGHFYISYFYFNALQNLMKWGGYDESTTMWVSVTIPALYAISIELGDGFSHYEFAPDDLVANALGLGYGVLQRRYQYLENFIFKWSYIPTGVYRGRLNYPITNDYDGHIYWLSFKMHNLLPEPVKQYWPKFLNLAVGYGAINASIGSTEPMKRKYAISLDYNLTELPLDGDTWETVKNIFDLLHFPAPGVRNVEGERSQFKPLLLN